MLRLKKIFLIFILCFVCVLNVNAETGYVTDKTGVNMRDNPNTKGTKVLIEIPYNAEFYISNVNAATGNGCAKSWYYVYYNGYYGYVCSSLAGIVGETNTTYDRPWNTPKKAIVGGAKYISEGYISKGQNSAYLKKFNVNPSGYYPQFNHQYMANLRAPAGDAYQTSKSLIANNLLGSSFNFSIPVYENMPIQSYEYNGLYSGFDLSTSDNTDASFEDMIKDFPNSYKPYLRYIHSNHSNWTFSPLKTNIDFNTLFLNEKNVSSIEISTGYCEQSPKTITESGWCIGNDDVTKYFLDPRNFLTERYIFMFEDLGYNDLYNESVVNTVLNNTFMKGNSDLDNQSYSSIFIDAGKVAKVSPLYLASLARQESGTEVSSTTNGSSFTYDGYSYSGLYNFFNIGASSSASNPTLAGLVWANGGRGTNNGNTSQESNNNDSNVNNGNSNTNSNVNISNDFVAMLQVAKTDDYIKGYSLGTTVSSIRDKVGTNVNLTVRDGNGSVKNNDDIIGTGYTIEVSNSSGSSTYIYVMYGDLNGDGEINSADLLKLRQHLLGINILTGANLKSAYLNDDGEINSADLLKMRQYLLGTSNIDQ